MAHRACEGNAIHAASEHIGRGLNSSHVGRSGYFDPGIHAMGPPQTEVHNGSTLRRSNEPNRLGCGHRLDVNLIHQACLDELRLRKRRDNFQYWFFGEQGRSFRKRGDRTGKPKAPQVTQKSIGETTERAKTLKGGFRETQVLQIAEDRVQSAGDQEVSPRRKPANEQRECRLFLQSLLQIGFEHRELIEIGQQGDIRVIYPRSTHPQRYNALPRGCAMVGLRREHKSQSPGSDSSLWTLALVFLRLGATAFGGPAAHIAMMEQEFVRKRRWLSREKFLDLLGAANLIPGPTSTEVGIYIGHLHAGWPGLLLAGICFIGPAAVLSLALAWAYTRLGALPSGNAVLYGIKPVIIAIVALALWSLARTAVRSWTHGAIALAGLVAAALGANLLLVLFGAGVLSVAMRRTARETARSSVVLVNLGLPGGIASAAPFSLTTLFLVFLKIGTVLFGSGYLLLAFLRADFVDTRHWLTEAQLLDAVAAGQVTPGPVSSTATFIGYLLGGVPGAAVATLGVFLPSFVFVAASGRLIPRLRQSPIIGAFLDGVNVASVALMTLVSWQLGRAAIIDVPTALLAIISAVALIRFEINSVWLILAGAFAGLVLGLR